MVMVMAFVFVVVMAIVVVVVMVMVMASTMEKCDECCVIGDGRHDQLRGDYKEPLIDSMRSALKTILNRGDGDDDSDDEIQYISE